MAEGQRTQGMDTPQQRAQGMTQDQLNQNGMDAFGHPTAPQQNGQGRQGGAMSRGRGKKLNQLLGAIETLDMGDFEDIYDLCTALKEISHFLAVSVQMASGISTEFARKAARDTASQMGKNLTPRERIKLAATLRRFGKDLEAVADDYADAGATAVKAWGRIDSYLVDVESNRLNDTGRRR